MFVKSIAIIEIFFGEVDPIIMLQNIRTVRQSENCKTFLIKFVFFWPILCILNYLMQLFLHLIDCLIVCFSSDHQTLKSI